MADKTYINKCWFREKQFDGGGKLLNCGLNVEELKKHADNNGWVNIIIAERRNISDKGYTHYAYLDEWKPKGASTNDQSDTDATPQKMPWDE